LGSRSRKRGRTSPRPATAPSAPRERQPRLRGEAADAAVRDQLEPLEPGERPTTVTVAAIVAAVLGIANIVLVAAGYELKDNSNGGPAGGVIFGIVLFIAAGGMWRAKYWAVLGFEALLAFTALIAFLSLLVASNVLGAVLSVVVLSGAGVLFYKLIRAMARIQMPQRPTAR
jgi:hypothetical protein